MDEMSIADAMALRGDNNGGFGDNGAFWIVLLFLFFGMNGQGFNQHGFGGAATAATQQEILLGQQFDRVENKLDGIGKGICDSTYAVTNAVTNEGRALQGQIAECCCEQRVGLQKLENKMDNMFKDAEIRSLYSRVNSLERDASLCGVVRYPMAMTYATNCNPFCGCQGNYGCGYQPNI